VGGVGVSAWFPLGPGEPYRPWYPASPRYIDEINVSNIGESPRVHVQTTYMNFDFGHVAFANRSRGFIAVSNDDFAAGRPVHQTNIVVDVHVTENIQVIERPVVQPSPRALIGNPPSRPIHVNVERPALVNESGKLVSAKPGAQPVEPPVKAAPQIKALPGRAAAAPPANVKAPVAAPASLAAPVAKPGTPVTEPTAAPAAKTTGRPAAPSADKTPAKSLTEPAAKPVTQPATKVAVQPAATPVTKPATQPAAKAATPAAKPQDKKADGKQNGKDKKDEKKPE
jgi:hypothetical protein